MRAHRGRWTIAGPTEPCATRDPRRAAPGQEQTLLTAALALATGLSAAATALASGFVVAALGVGFSVPAFALAALALATFAFTVLSGAALALATFAFTVLSGAATALTTLAFSRLLLVGQIVASAQLLREEGVG